MRKSSVSAPRGFAQPPRDAVAKWRYLRVDELPVSDLPSRWRAYPAPEAVQEVGDGWLRSGAGPALRVPSAVVPREHNLLLNPVHPDFRRIEVDDPEPFHFDPRMWK